MSEYTPAATGAHAQGTSPDTTTVIVIAPPNKGVHGCFITVDTTDARVTFDGSTPTGSNGLLIKKDLAPIFIPIARRIQFVSSAVANSIVNVLWVG